MADSTPIFKELLRQSSGVLGLYDHDAKVREWFRQADADVDGARFGL